jgi:hypothetical protein
MSFQCYCDYDDNPTWYSAKRSVARKRYRCDECGGPIFAGEKRTGTLLDFTNA